MVIEIFENLGYCSQGSVAMPTQLKSDGILVQSRFAETRLAETPTLTPNPKPNYEP